MPQRPFQRPIIHTPHKCCDILSFFTRIHPWVYTTLTQVQAQTVWIEELINNKIPWLGLGRSNSRKIFLYSRKSLQSPETIKHTHPNKNIDVIPNNSFQPGHEHWGRGANCKTLNWHLANTLSSEESSGPGVACRVSQRFLSTWCVDAWDVGGFLSAQTPLETFALLLTPINHLLHRPQELQWGGGVKCPLSPSTVLWVPSFPLQTTGSILLLRQECQMWQANCWEKLQGKLPTAPTTRTLQERQRLRLIYRRVSNRERNQLSDKATPISRSGGMIPKEHVEGPRCQLLLSWILSIMLLFLPKALISRVKPMFWTTSTKEISMELPPTSKKNHFMFFYLKYYHKQPKS